METVDPLLPMTALLKRFESAKKVWQDTHDRLPWWRIKRRYGARLAIAVFDNEIDDLLAIMGSCQMSKFKSLTEL